MKNTVLDHILVAALIKVFTKIQHFLSSGMLSHFCKVLSVNSSGGLLPEGRGNRERSSLQGRQGLISEDLSPLYLSKASWAVLGSSQTKPSVQITRQVDGDEAGSSSGYEVKSLRGGPDQ